MKRPQDAMKAAYTLQGFATVYYTVFAIVMYVYLGPSVASPAFSSLPPKWQKATYGIALPNFLVAGSLYAHTSAKLFFVRLFRNSTHLHEHTVIGWGVWTVLIIVLNGAAFVLAVGVPIFSELVGIAASLFASWYTVSLLMRCGARFSVLISSMKKSGNYRSLLLPQKLYPANTNISTASPVPSGYTTVTTTTAGLKLG